MLPAGNTLRVERPSVEGACAYRAGPPNAHAAIAAAGIHRIINPPPYHGRPEAGTPNYDTVNGTFRVTVCPLVLSVTLISSRYSPGLNASFTGIPWPTNT